MVIPGTKLKVADNTGILEVRCICLLNATQIGKLGDYIIVSVLRYNTKKGLLRDKRKRKMLKKGTILRGIIVRTERIFGRGNGVQFLFNDSAVVLLNKKYRPLGTKVPGPLLKEFKKWNINICALCDDLI